MLLLSDEVKIGGTDDWSQRTLVEGSNIDEMPILVSERSEAEDKLYFEGIVTWNKMVSCVQPLECKKLCKCECRYRTNSGRACFCRCTCAGLGGRLRDTTCSVETSTWHNKCVTGSKQQPGGCALARTARQRVVKEDGSCHRQCALHRRDENERNQRSRSSRKQQQTDTINRVDGASTTTQVQRTGTNCVVQGCVNQRRLKGGLCERHSRELNN